ncbi:hypothetical protein ACJX0J_011500, partial [Zea mays]
KEEFFIVAGIDIVYRRVSVRLESIISSLKLVETSNFCVEPEKYREYAMCKRGVTNMASYVQKTQENKLTILECFHIIRCLLNFFSVFSLQN